MKEYNPNEYYEIGERLIIKGVTVELVKDDEFNGVCESCFINELSNRDIKCSSLCSGIERKDDTSVHFQLVDLAKKNTPEYEPYDPNKEYAIYERFQHNGVVAECRKCSSPLLCRDCVLYPCNGASIKACKCMVASREDKTSVYYKVLTDVRP